jgi:hypothetical protein
MEAKWSSLISYGLSLDALKDFLPLDLSLDVKTVRYDTLKVAKRLEAELGVSFRQACLTSLQSSVKSHLLTPIRESGAPFDDGADRAAIPQTAQLSPQD